MVQKTIIPQNAIEEYAKICDDFFIWGKEPQLSDNQQIDSLLICNQMVLEKEIPIEITEEIKQLGEENYAEIQAFMKQFYPHYFVKNHRNGAIFRNF